ncbi:hypothetical protein BCON_0011g00820 [Botryotinia convoluta]|uniref:Uncharacterized protein n=1 Tax=Botryotinia convoluta TaxID=54673 RepID=A0A4Z1IQA7_9HELO|nr:hypothetical protein BCON_0011g00820 [Botryotinia convoluta]
MQTSQRLSGLARSVKIRQSKAGQFWYSQSLQLYFPGWAFSRLVGITVAVSVPLIGLAFFVNEATELLLGLRRTTKSKRPTFQGNSSSDSLENEISRHATTVAPDQHEATKSAPRKWSRRGLGAVRRVIGGKCGNEEAPINVSEA